MTLKPFKKGISNINSFQRPAPFKVKRIFYIYNVFDGCQRGKHAHILCHQVIFSLCGAFKVGLDDSKNKCEIYLNSNAEALYVPPGIWVNQKNFNPGSVCLVLASHEFEEKDYIRDYKNFLNYKK